MVSEKEDIKGVGSELVVLTAVIHCEGCARKLKRSLIKHLDGVDKVKVNYESKKVTVLGKVEPAKVKERVEIKTKKPAHLLSPKPKPDKDPVQIKPPVHLNKTNDHTSKEFKPQVQEVADAGATFVLKTRVHCDNCVHKINKIIKKYEGVEDVDVDLEKDNITVKGKMDMKEMVPFLNTKLKRVVKIRPPPAADGGKTFKEKSKGDCEEKILKKEDEEKPEIATKKEEENPKTVNGDASEGRSSKEAVEELTASRVEVVRKMEYNGYEYGTYMYDPQQVQGKGYQVEYWNSPSPFYFHAPEMFSDENPNAACSIM